MKVNVYEFLPDDAKMIRKKVFMEEQAFENEFDDIDKVALHIVMYDENEEPIATCRIFEGSEESKFVFGRLAVIESCRGMNIGTKMIREAEKLVKERGGISMSLHAQCRVKTFYEKLGYTEFGEIEDDEGCPHIWMSKQI
ncbi:MAG: GNAT family N-acetyltransferase [Lachnospiraceae bacterium]